MAPTSGLRTFRSLQVRNFRLFLGGQLVSVSGGWMQIVALSLMVLADTGSGTAVGAVVLLQYLPLMLLASWTGALLDRRDTWGVLVGTQSLQCALASALWAVTVLGGFSLPAVLGYSAIVGLVQSIDNPARRTFLHEMVGSERVANAVALNSAVMTSARLVGPAAAGFLVAAGLAPWCLAANALSYAVIVACLLVMRRAELRRSALPSASERTVLAGVRYAVLTPEIAAGLGITAAIAMLLQNHPVIVPLLVDGSPEITGLLFAALSLGSLCAAFAVATFSRTGLRLVGLAAAAFGLVAAVTALSPNVVILGGLLAVLGAAEQVFTSTSNATLQLLADPAYRARVMALYSASFLGIQGLGALGAGAIADLVGPRGALAAAGGLAVVAGLAVYAVARVRSRAGRGVGQIAVSTIGNDS